MTYTSTRKRVKQAAAKPAPKKRGRPVGSKNKQAVVKAYEVKPVDWEKLAKKLQRALASEMKENQQLLWQIGYYKDRAEQLENQSWLSRLFNLK